MSFVASKSFVVNGATTTAYVIEHPQLGDANNSGNTTRGLRNLQVEIANMTTGVVYVALDRAVVPPSGTGVQGVLPAASNPRSGPLAATPGDFDFAVTSGNGWGAIDFTLPYSSQYMSIYIVTAGIAVVNYGAQL